jgi:fructose-specific phosphotransferase system IIC component
VDQRLAYVFAIVVGTIVTAISINVVKGLSRKREHAAQAAA